MIHGAGDADVAQGHLTPEAVFLKLSFEVDLIPGLNMLKEGEIHTPILCLTLGLGQRGKETGPSKQ